MVKLIGRAEQSVSVTKNLSLWPSSFRKGFIYVLCCLQRLEQRRLRRAGFHLLKNSANVNGAPEMTTAMTTAMTNTSSILIPIEVWKQILSYLDRGSFSLFDTHIRSVKSWKVIDYRNNKHKTATETAAEIF